MLTVYGKDLGNHNFLHCINFQIPKNRNWDRFGSRSSSIRGLLTRAIGTGGLTPLEAQYGAGVSASPASAGGARVVESPGSRTCNAGAPGWLHRGGPRLTGHHYLSSKCWFGWKKQTSIFWKVPFLLFCELCVALPAGAVQTQKFLLSFFCFNTGRIKVDSTGTSLQNCQIQMKPATWQTTGPSCS